MNKSGMYRLMTGSLVSVMTVFSAMTASAAGNNSIRIINIQNSDKKPIEDWNLSIYEVASFDSSTFSYSITDDFDEYVNLSFITEEQKANDISNKASELQNAITEKGFTAISTAASDAQGTVTFEGLQDGIYLICYQENETYDSSPSFVAVPDYDYNSSVTIESKVEDKTKGGDTPGTSRNPGGSNPGGGGGNSGGGNDGGGSPSGGSNPPSDPGSTVETLPDGSVLGEDRDREVPDVSGPEEKIVLGAKRAPHTGDESRMNLYRSIATLALAILFAWGIIYYKRNRGTDKH